MATFTGSVHAFFPAGNAPVTATFQTNPTQTLPAFITVGSMVTITGAAHAFFNGTFTVSAITSVNGVNDALQFVIANANPGGGNVTDNNVTLMATVKCDLNTLNKAQNCFDCFSELQNQAAMVYLLNLTLATLQGVTAQTPVQLRQTAACLNCTRPESVCDGLDVAVAQAGAVVAGVPNAAMLTTAQIKAGANPFRNMSLSELRSIEVILRCQLNAFL